MPPKRYNAVPVIPRRTSLRATLDLLAYDLTEAILGAVRAASLTDLAELLEPQPAARGARSFAGPTADAHVPAPRLDLRASPPVRSARPGSARAPRLPRRAPPQQLELLPHVEAYADVAIDNPAALLGGSTPTQDAPRVSVAPARSLRWTTRGPFPGPGAAAPDPVAPPGEEILRATGGGVVLRRRRPPNSSDAPERAARWRSGPD